MDKTSWRITLYSPLFFVITFLAYMKKKGYYHGDDFFLSLQRNFSYLITVDVMNILKPKKSINI